MQREIQLTADGFSTIAIPQMRVTYHSRHGAWQESRHVYIKHGLDYMLQRQPRHEPLRVFEMGFGAGLNALLSLQYILQHQKQVFYSAVEPYPVSAAEAGLLNYTALMNNGLLTDAFAVMHAGNAGEDIPIHALFTLHKIKLPLQQYLRAAGEDAYDVIYYDAFAPSAQPELWTAEIFRQLFEILRTGGILVTYCSKGDVRRAIQTAGFTVEKLPGPPGKREMLRASKREEKLLR
ncbi:tRNA (5-methylaminomethyl-2-thiouridine)(34)-methyltransferase MnmD [Foetidibacter luteolus]|uniref:tRNA (5-methylaminomethyl-2-thiouridine)(34)-methyltransferase MnmD n=1 Tax=Foetidibacter luteolus TaxID=2608880 RepID=UPI00129ABCFB|nr:tRNA (5-methylaminomethyl-2-thiouridine)(34)-methyltransferase MnmD [Foetidibacter luteolus]